MKISKDLENQFGKEPEAPAEPIDSIEASKILTYYNNVSSAEDRREWFREYLKLNGFAEALEATYHVPDYMFSVSGRIARMHNRGFKIKDIPNFYDFDDIIRDIKSEATKNIEKKKEVKEVPVKTAPTRSSKETITTIAEIQLEIDAFVLNNYKSSFKYDKWVADKNLSVPTQTAIREKIQPMLDEIKNSDNDPQLCEGYSQLGKQQKAAFISFLSDMVDGDIIKATITIIKPKKARKKKEITPEKQVKSLKYLKEFKKLNISSIEPIKVVDSNSLWVYNVSSRVLTNYKSLSGIKIKGSTLLEWDEKESVSKKLRKPEEVIPNILSEGKVYLRNIMDDLSTKPVVPNGRINKDTILLRKLNN